MRITYHLRRRMRPRGGNSFYLDRSERKVATFCGAPVTSYDDDWRSKALPWMGNGGPQDGDQFVPCEECKQQRKGESKWKK